MSTTEMIGQLRGLGVNAAVLKLGRADLKKVQAPPLDEAVQERLREEIGTHQRAVLVLSRDGKGYSVFSPEGHAALRASARRNKPWMSIRKAAKKAKKVAETKH